MDTAAKKLLDKAAANCSPSNYAGLAARLEVTSSLISAWKLGRYPMPEDQIARIARIAQADPGDWLVLIEAEQARGEARKAYGSLVKRLGIAALLGLFTLPAAAQGGTGAISCNQAGNPYYVAVRRLLNATRGLLKRRRIAVHGPLLALPR